MTALLERDGEIAEIERRLADLDGARGSLYLVEGAPGVGKSALIGALAERARARGAQVLTAVGGELERDFPFGMVRQLLEPVVLGAPPERRDELLAGASAPAGPIVGGTQAVASADAGFATLHGLYWLVAALAEEAPVVLLFDDVHWADAPSLRFLDFLARRLADVPVLAAVAMRPNEPGAEQLLLDGLARAAGSEVARPGLLSEAATAVLMDERMGEGTAPEVVSAAHAATGGNPLLLRELGRTLAAGSEPLSAEVVEAALPSSVTRSVQARLAAMDPSTRDVAVALAVLGDRASTDVLAATTGGAPAQVADVLDVLRAAELVSGQPPVYTHPLLRQAVADSASRSERDELHRTAAQYLNDSRGDENQMLAHLLAAPPLDADWARDALRVGGLRAMAEGAADAAVTRLTRAVDSSAGDVDPALLLELGQATLLNGQTADAIAHLRRAEQADDPVVSASAVLVRVAAEILTGSEGNAERADALQAALDRLPADAPPPLVDELLGNLHSTVTLDRRLAGRREEMFRRLAEGPDLTSQAAIAAWETASGTESAADVKAHASRALASRPLQTLSGLEGGSALWAVVASHVVDGPEVADLGLRDAEETARRSGTRIGRAQAAAMRAEWELAFGSAARAEANAHQALEIYRGMGLDIMIDTAIGSLTNALVLMDRLDEAAEVIATAAIDDYSYTSCIVRQARAALHLARGQSDAAVADLEAIQDLCDTFGWRRFARMHAGVDLARALAAGGRREEAIDVARGEVEFAGPAGRTSLEVAALTALGTITGGDEGLEHLAAAVEAGARAESPVVQATASIEYGSALRRAGQRAEARDHLRTGGEIAARIGAKALEERALEELSIAGARQRDPFSSGVESLTPSERRVAEHAARGLTNREIAETLFVTQKTIEVHLGNTYGKLGIRSRNQLQAALGGQLEV